VLAAVRMPSISDRPAARFESRVAEPEQDSSPVVLGRGVNSRMDMRRTTLSTNLTRSTGGQTMLIVHVHVHVLPELVDAFKEATSENARHSLQEPGIARFDVVQDQEDPTRFVLVEAYRTPDAAAAHKETGHYQIWRDTVAPMMAEPRSSVKYANVFPEAKSW